jgi:hypothetical protein
MSKISVSENEVNFINDFFKVILYRDKINLIVDHQFQNNIDIDKDRNYLYKIIDKQKLKNLYQHGINFYYVKFSFQFFIDEIIIKKNYQLEKEKKRFSAYSFYSKNIGGKYIRKSTHLTKIKSTNDLNKEEWRRSKKFSKDKNKNAYNHKSWDDFYKRKTTTAYTQKYQKNLKNTTLIDMNYL